MIKLTVIFICLLMAMQISTSYASDNRSPTRSAMNNSCSLKPAAGPCRAAFRKYYYDTNSGTCKMFIWGGCRGVVPFNSLGQCKNTCTTNKKDSDKLKK